MFCYEWTGRHTHHEDDEARGLAAAQAYCAEHDINPADVWADLFDDNGNYNPTEWAEDTWRDIELEAYAAAFGAWEMLPDNVSLVWRG